MKNSSKRIFHPWWEWEHYKHGFFETSIGIENTEDYLNQYADFLRNLPRFEKAILRVFKEWPKSCEHFLSNPSINRVAWLGQAAMCIETHIPARYRAGYKLLTEKEQKDADNLAQQYITLWEENENQKISS